MLPPQPDLAATSTDSAEVRQPKRPITISKRYLKARLDPEGDLLWAFSEKEGRLLFGRESFQVHKVQAGVRVRGSKRECKVRLAPDSVEYFSRPFDSIRLSEAFETVTGDSTALIRRIRISNLAHESIRLVVTTLNDPTTINFRGETDPPGAIGVNAFNRGDHVAMDDLGDDAGARVIGSTPTPRAIYMTRDRLKALEILERGEIPESTAGMSGPVIILTQHQLDIAPQGSEDLVFLSIYDPSRLEGALSTFNEIVSMRGRLPKTQRLPEPFIASSSGDLSFALPWAAAALNSLEGESDLLDRLETIVSLSFVNPGDCSRVLAQAKATQFKNGSLPHSLDGTREGVLETALFLMHASLFFILSGDKRQVRSSYTALKRASSYLIQSSRSGLIHTDSSLPQGWRRHLRVGYPKGVLTEVNLTAAKALLEFSSLASFFGKGPDSARAREAGARLLDALVDKLVEPDSGNLALGVDERGRLRRDDSIDQVIACYRLAFDRNISSSLVRRFLEKDFETGFGPRTVPTSSLLFANGSYMEGQIGGYWTRAALAHAILSYRAGYPGIGSAQLLKVSKLVRGALGGLPGEFPHWLDPESGTLHGDGSDIVAASRLVEAVVYGELGLSDDRILRPPRGSELKWLLVSDLWFGEKSAVFVGREGGKVQVAATSGKIKADVAISCQKFEHLDSSNSQVVAVQFTDPGQVMCTGNLSDHASSGTITVPLRDPPLLSQLFGSIEKLDPSSGRWVGRTSIKLLEKMRINVDLPARGWEMLRISPSQPSSLS